MAIILVQSIMEEGIPSPTRRNVSAEGDKWENSGSEFVEFQNKSEASVVVTFTAVVTSFDSPIYGPSTKSSRTMTVGAGLTSLIGPFVPSAFNSEDGYCSISYSSVAATITVAIFTF